VSRLNKRRRRKKPNQNEQDVSDLQALRVLVELLFREKVEKEVYESKQELEAAYKHVLELAMRVRDVTEKMGVDSNLSEINAIIQRVEDKAKQIDEAFDNVTASPEAVNLDMHLLTSGRVSIPKEAEVLIEELELFFAQATGEILILSRKQIQYALENNKQARDEIAKGIINYLSSIRSHKDQVPTDEQLLTDLDALEKKIVTSQRSVDAEVDGFLQHLKEPIEDMLLVYNEYERILHLLGDFHRQINEELEHLTHILEPLQEKRRLRRQRQRLSATVKVILIDATMYLLWSIQQGMFQPQINAVFAFVITGIIVTVITFKATVTLVAFEDDHTALFNVTKSPALNKLIMHGISIFVMALLVIFSYIVILYYLYLLLYSLFNYLDTINKALTWVVNISTIVSVAFILAGKLKQFDLRGNVKHLFSLLSGR
jgi:hypothetical protein